MPEEKASSKSGCNYSTYKATKDIDKFMKLVTKLINTAVKHSFLLLGWKQVTQKMPSKKLGESQVNVLQIIQLLEADMNLYLYIIWSKRTVPKATKLNLILLEQYV